ncbi:unnamed protein product [Adineta steineri]|uniref:Uncharacterized protein n=1 Tax=Adineta steineri TaxID=433720 RepID=A0A815RHH5_9BILA|nr:unnamed protein product [Adineta steineri]CAF1477258.1 unnamed protein product [Adineta steineri]
MKTCSYRGAMPRFKNIEGLFCGNDEPEARYTLTPCASLLCPYCYPSNHWQKSQPWPVIDFASSSKYQFVNGYITYLNCPATCKTSNIIYAMTCPCGHYDYVDSTTQTLADAMTYHRKHGNRIIFEKLIGSPLFSGSLLDPYEKEQETANKMRLYQHSARCPIALRSFLECNPNYWCFIPMLLHEALAENILYTRTSNYSTAELYDFIPMIAIDNQRVENYLSHIPLSPVSYAFSYQQRQKQRLFFESIVPFSTNEQSLPYSPLHLYKVALIVVLPDDCSMILRYILQSLFIVHGEPKLNMICPLGGDPEKRYGRAYDLVWCAGLNHSLLTMPRSNQD